MIATLVADDSLLIRKRITRILESDRRIKVVGTAADGVEVIEKIKELKPDVLTLDVEMPRMNGLDTLRALNQENIPVQVIMLSALTREGADVTLKALELGAIDFIPKPNTVSDKSMEQFSRDLLLKIRAAALIKSGRRPKSFERKAGRERGREIRTDFTPSVKKISSNTESSVVIGISTGGPKTLIQVIPKIPENFKPAVFIAQHMPAGFTASLAERLNGMSKIKVKEARNGETVKPGTCYIAPGGRHMTVKHMSLSKGVMIKVGDEPYSALYKPSVDVLFESVAEVYGSHSVGIIMTGMGRDGTKGASKLKSRGGVILAEDESTATVFGMPKSVMEAGVVDNAVPADDMAETLLSCFDRG